jgi:hypothetical protein
MECVMGKFAYKNWNIPCTTAAAGEECGSEFCKWRSTLSFSTPQGWLLVVVDVHFDIVHSSSSRLLSTLWTVNCSPSVKINKHRKNMGKIKKKERNNLNLNILHNCYWHGKGKRSEQTNKIQQQSTMESEIRWKEIFFNLHQHVLPFFHRPDDVAAFCSTQSRLLST